MYDFNIQYLTRDQSYVFRFNRDSTAYFLQYIGRLAATNSFDFDWFDAAAVSTIFREQRELFDEEKANADRNMKRIVNRLEHIL